jgi:hypothetical protein
VLCGSTPPSGPAAGPLLPLQGHSHVALPSHLAQEGSLETATISTFDHHEKEGGNFQMLHNGKT